MAKHLTVTAVFGGLSFKSNELNIHHSAFPPGWTIVIQSQDELDPASGDDAGTSDEHASSTIHTHRYRLPTLQRDEIFISSISNPSSSDFKPPHIPISANCNDAVGNFMVVFSSGRFRHKSRRGSG